MEKAEGGTSPPPLPSSLPSGPYFPFCKGKETRARLRRLLGVVYGLCFGHERLAGYNA